MRLTALVFLAILTAGCGIEDWFSSTTQGSGGTCTKNREELVELLVNPRGCAASEQCPAGSHCNPATDVCDWECFADTDCGAAGVCDCLGQCGDEPLTPPPEGDPACPRERDLLVAIAASERTCLLDEDCPYGAHCDETTRICTWECLGSDDATAPCDPGAVCDCRGVCTDGAPSAPAIGARKLFLDASGTSVPVTADWTERELTLTLRGEPPADPAAVALRAAEGLEVSCDGATWATACVLTGWTFSGDPAWVASQTFRARPVDASLEAWIVTATSEVVTEPLRITFRSVAPIAAVALTGEYRGSARLVGAGRDVEVSDRGMRFPVRGFAGVAGGEPVVVLVDRLGVFPGHAIRLRPNVDQFLPWIGGGELADLGLGTTMSVRFTQTAFEHLPEAGVIRGGFEVRVPFEESSCAHETDRGGGPLADGCSFCVEQVCNVDSYCCATAWDPICQGEARDLCPTSTTTLRFDYELIRTGDGTACTGHEQCFDLTEPVDYDDLSLCDATIGICLHGGGMAASATRASNGLATDVADDWRDALERTATTASGTLIAPTDIYDGVTGVASVNLGTHRDVVAAAAIYATGGRGGRALCGRDFPGLLQWMKDSLGGAANSARMYYVSPTTSWETPTTPNLCSRVYPSTLGYDDRVPCIDRNAVGLPAGSANAFTGLPAAKRASCQDLHENWVEATGSTATYDAFRSSQCTVSPGQLELQTTTGTTRYPVHLCPYQPSLIGPLDARSEAERILGYDPVLGSTLTLTSEKLGGTVLPISGDLATEDGRAPHGLDLVHHADAEFLGEAPIGGLDMAAQCLAALDRAPPVITTTLSWDELFATDPCFSAAHFFTALDALRDGMSTVSTDNTTTARRKSAVLFQRLIAGWLEVHAFLAEEAGRAQTLAVLLRSGYEPDASGAEGLGDLGALLDREATALHLILATDQTSKLGAIPPEQLRAPDYRVLAGGGEQTVGLPVAILEALIVDLRLVERLLEETSFASHAECLTGVGDGDRDEAMARFRTALRMTTAAEALAWTLYDRATVRECTAVTTCGTGFSCVSGACRAGDGTLERQAISWSDRWDQASDQLAAARQAAFDRAAALEECRNPFGFEQGDVPLFFGDVSGDSSRFFASSDYLMNGWAVPAVAAAEVSLEGARQAWNQRRLERIQDLESATATDRRREDLAASYGREIVALCGLTGIAAEDALSAFGYGPDPASTPMVFSETCFMDLEDPACEPPTQGLVDATTIPAAKMRLCLFDRLGELMNLDPETRETAGGFLDVVIDGPTVETSTGELPISDLFAYLEDLPRDQLDAAVAECAELLGEVADLPTITDVGFDVADRAACFRGELGEAILGMLGAEKNLATARAAWAEQQARYARHTEACLARQAFLADTDEITSRYHEQMRKLETAEKKSSMWSTVASGFVGTVLSAGAALATGNPITAGILLFGGMLGLGSDLQQIDLADDMKEAEHVYQEVMSRRLHAGELAQCWYQADLAKIGIDSAAKAAETAMVAVQLELVRFRNLKRRLDQLLVDGGAATRRDAAREVADLGFHYWFDERVERFERDFRWAKRLLYLAMRAVEYEFQQSLGLEDAILSAKHPTDLQAAVTVLRQEQLTRTINSRRPAEASIVLSLTHDLLGLAPIAPLAPGERAVTSIERLQERLVADEVTDEEGAYVGQGITFTIPVEGPLRNRCAERLWRVTATIQGDFSAVTTPAIPVFLVKRNDFASQWCEGRGDGDELQYGSLQPASRLFADDAHGGTEAAPVPYTTAMITPWINARRSDFHREAYAEGASEELAGRGLYGEYTLVFPAWLGDSGFDLGEVEDVLIRFDFLSVDDF